jgi:hypothetical protein
MVAASAYAKFILCCTNGGRKMTTTTSPQEPEWPLAPLIFWVLVAAGYAVVAGGLLYAILVH